MPRSSLNQTCWCSCLPLSCVGRFAFHPPPSHCPCGVLVPESVWAALCLAPQWSSYGAEKLPRSLTLPVAVKSVLSPPQLSLLPAAAINLVEETSVMSESNFISSFINQVSAECLSPGEGLRKRHGFFALLLNLGEREWGKRRQLGLFLGKQN